jgi:hypothetical protein
VAEALFLDALGPGGRFQICGESIIRFGITRMARVVTMLTGGQSRLAALDRPRPGRKAR